VFISLIGSFVCVWLRTETLRSMAQHIQTVRQLLFQKLKALGTPGSWDHIVQQNGMFCYTGLSG